VTLSKPLAAKSAAPPTSPALDSNSSAMTYTLFFQEVELLQRSR
jgi:hypothetical protein